MPIFVKLSFRFFPTQSAMVSRRCVHVFHLETPFPWSFDELDPQVDSLRVVDSDIVLETRIIIDLHILPCELHADSESDSAAPRRLELSQDAYSSIGARKNNLDYLGMSRIIPTPGHEWGSTKCVFELWPFPLPYPSKRIYSALCLFLPRV